jgi:glycosyltransferase involved in cell wall biosynthesis
VIVLFEPQRAPGFESGGYRYQAEILGRLAARGEGELHATRPDGLDAAIADARRRHPGATVVVDGLFVALSGRPLPADVVALLHGVPAQATWSRGPVPVIATSRPTADAVRAAAARVAIVRPGLDACFVPGLSRGVGSPLRIVCTGTIGPGKGQLLLARSLAAAVASGIACELVLLGDDRTAPDYAAQVRRTAASLPVHVLGVRPPAAVAAELQRADLFVSASRQESFGMAVAEAAACGVPVLAFATGEIATFVRDGANGWLVPAAADDAAFAAKLHAVLGAPARLASARASAQRPPLTGWDDVAARFREACRDAFL